MNQHTVLRRDDSRRDDEPISLLADLAEITTRLADAPAAADLPLDDQPAPVVADRLVSLPLHLAVRPIAPTVTAIPRAADPASTASDDEVPDDELRARIATIIATGGPTIVFQPIVHVETGCVIGAEALSRFPGPLDPRGWFEAAHRVGLGDELELSAIDAALHRLDAVSWEQVDWNFVGLNVSTRVLFDPRFVEMVEHHPAGRLLVEITEQTAMPELPLLRQHLVRLRELGVRVAVNELRCTTTNFERVMMIEPEFVKLDVDFTAALVREPDRAAEAATLLDTCRRFGVNVVAVGVEHPDELTLLRRLGVDAVQGHLFGLPYAVGPGDR